MITFKEKADNKKYVEELLHPIVKKWFFSRFQEFSSPQLYGVTEVHARNNILVSAPTGATKTLTAFMSILNELVDNSEKGILKDKIYAVYISPLKALSNDIFVNLTQPLEQMEDIAGKKLGIRVSVRTGDTTASEKQKMLKKVPHILLTTPETLALLLSSLKFSEHLKQVDWLILDEIHAIADSKRGVHLSLSLERLQRLSPGMCRVGLSATVSPLNLVAEYLAGNDRDCKIIDVQYLKKNDIELLSPVEDFVTESYVQIEKKTYELLDRLIQEHKTTLVFTNTRAATERVVHHLKEKFPHKYLALDEETKEKMDLIGAHHGSLSKEHRLKLENDLRAGKLRCVVTSTSLELGLDIGSIDLVICLGSPKSVARLLQRIGRSNHHLSGITKGKILVQDRDDLVECAVMLKYAKEKKMDRIHIPTNCLDVLAQQLFGMALEGVWDAKEMYHTVKKSYCYRDLSKKDFEEVLDYLAGNFISLEERYIYARIWWNKEEGKVGKKGRMSRVIYMTNIGTIPDQQGVIVKDQRGNKIGMIDEAFLEKLSKGDIFVLGGNTYQFNFARGMVAQVIPMPGKKPTVPSWFSDRLPLSYDLAQGIGNFRELMEDQFKKKKDKKSVLQFIHDYLYVDNIAAEALYNYCRDQYDYIGMPSSKKLLIEHYRDEQMKNYVVFHALYGRRVNDVLSRAVAFAISRAQHKDVELGISDNGFYISYDRNVNVSKAFSLLKSKELRKVLELAVDKSEILKRRFRHCAGRALMILRNYGGIKRRVGRQQVSSMILLNAVRRISENFFILRETRREVLEDLMDYDSALEVLQNIEEKKITIEEIHTFIPSPFALNLVMQGYSDILRLEDKQQFLQRMHQMVKAKIALKNR
ncbi:MAG: ATP-dependent helicase Lhr and Lhr-like protein helicase [archaeon GW2011_AR17]|nr:MAG: ATP-dependent helicase Lhr and Lhr-like protein helicase [archaeon GW2011_AR17]MBS3154771.1 ATP-dependent helicase [Candidatus Woesearchaeota archaeon]HIH15215.1 ATP-dependent helicase [Nanoarchaeota archaeon]